MIDEYDIDVDGIPVHCYEAGGGTPLLFLHGSGFGVNILSNFRRAIPVLANDYRVIGADLIGFGQSGRKPDEPYFDMELWIRQALALIEHSGADRVALVGHSLSGPIVLKAAARTERVAAVFTTGTMGTGAAQVRNGPRWRSPDGRDAIRAAVERTMYDPAHASAEEIDRREAKLTEPGYPEYFTKMFDGDPDRYLDGSAVTESEFDAIRCPVVLMHGRQDRSFSPDETSLPLGEALPTADVVVLDRCAHSVAHERTEMFLAAIRATFPPEAD